jgi:hypothetical protein
MRLLRTLILEALNTRLRMCEPLQHQRFGEEDDVPNARLVCGTRETWEIGIHDRYRSKLLFV